MVRFSVIITAYDRKDYLLSSVESVLLQTCQRNYFEIIVVKNYYDSQIDSFLEKNSITNIVDYSPYWNESLMNALRVAKGEIIVFLDDDDLFAEEKLSTLDGIFKNSEIVFAKDGIIPFEVRQEIRPIMSSEVTQSKIFYIDKNGELVGPRSVLTSYNNSSMSIRRYVLEKYISKLNDRMPSGHGCRHSIDNFLIFSSLESGKGIILSEKLTFYRIHPQQITLNKMEHESFYERKIRTELVFQESYKGLINAFDSSLVLNRVEDMIIQSELQVSILSKSDKTISITLLLNGIKQFLKHHEKFFILLIGLYILKPLIPNIIALLFRSSFIQFANKKASV